MADGHEKTEIVRTAEAVEDRTDEVTAPEVASTSAGGDDSETSETDEPSRSHRPGPAPPRRRGRVATLYRALRSERPIEGKVEQVIKGGYEVRLGKVRGFCPHSHFDLHRVEDPARHVGQSYLFRIMQVRRGGDDVVVSRRAVLEAERRDEAAAVRATLIEGAVTRGHVASVAGFGAFVDLGAGVMGLVHVSELSHSRVARVEDVVHEGDVVNVKILKLLDSGRKISLSIRQAERDPWSEVATTLHPGHVRAGTIRRLTQFGAFVELAPGVEALAPASEFPPSTGGWKDGLSVGDSRDWLVLSVDAAQRRISLTPPVEGFDPASVESLAEGKLVKGKVQRVEDFGVFVWLAPGRVGLMPNALSGTPRDADLRRRFPIGEEIEVEIREIEEDGRRIRLARKGIELHEERRPRRESRSPRPSRPSRPPRDEARAPASGSTGFGTSLADKLRAALGNSLDR